MTNGQLFSTPRRTRRLPSDDPGVSSSVISNLALACGLEAATQNVGPWEGFLAACQQEAVRQVEVAKVRVARLAQEVRARQKAAEAKGTVTECKRCGYLMHPYPHQHKCDARRSR